MSYLHCHKCLRYRFTRKRKNMDARNKFGISWLITKHKQYMQQQFIAYIWTSKRNFCHSSIVTVVNDEGRHVLLLSLKLENQSSEMIPHFQPVISDTLQCSFTTLSPFFQPASCLKPTWASIAYGLHHLSTSSLPSLIWMRWTRQEFKSTSTHSHQNEHIVESWLEALM